MRLLCWLGWHRWRVSSEVYHYQFLKCRRCRAECVR